jgi:hypothetical protein
MGLNQIYPAPPSVSPYTSQPPINASSVIFDGIIKNNYYASINTTTVNSGVAYIYANQACTMFLGSNQYSITANSGSIGILPSGNISLTIQAPSGTYYNFNAVTLPIASKWRYIDYGTLSSTPYFVAIGRSGSTGSDQAYSNDGINWNSSTLPFVAQWNTLKYLITSGSTPYFFATTTATSGTAAYSSNATTWTTVQAFPSGAPYTVGIANGLISGTYYSIATLSTSTNTYYYQNSTISSVWVAGNFPTTATFSTALYGAVSGVNYFVVLDGSNAGYYSTNGTTWSTMSGKSFGATYLGSYGVISGTPYFIYINTNTSSYVYSTNARTWISGNFGTSLPYSSITFGNIAGSSGFIVVNSSGNTNSIYSLNGTTWSTFSGIMPLSTTTTGYSSIVYGTPSGNPAFVALGNTTAGSVDTLAAYSSNTSSGTVLTPIQFGIYAGPTTIQ